MSRLECADITRMFSKLFHTLRVYICNFSTFSYRDKKGMICWCCVGETRIQQFYKYTGRKKSSPSPHLVLSSPHAKGRVRIRVRIFSPDTI